MGSSKREAVKVIIRCRPFNSKEKKLGCNECVNLDEKTGEIVITKSKDVTKQFTFDACFGEKSEQKGVYDKAARPIVDSVIEGYNGTVFAYGQTGAGKTFTMEGCPGNEGLIPNAFKHIFEAIQDSFEKEAECLVQASMLEIYNEEIRDLLGKNPKQKLSLKEHPDKGVYVNGLTTYVVKNEEEIKRVLHSGKSNRAVGATDMNKGSSRSHCVFIVRVETSVKSSVDGENHIRVGKLNMVDLAGSERSKKTGATGDRAIEGININKSLSALGNVIYALVSSKTTHIPYRNSKLTRLLQDSLGGNTKTVMIANISPADYNYDETLSTLRYATACKKIKNKPKINEDPKDAMLRAFQEQIESLKEKLEKQQHQGGQTIVSGEAHAKKLQEMIEKNAEEKERIRQAIQQKTEAEKAALLKQQTEIERKREEYESKLKQQQQAIAKEKDDEENLKTALKRVQSQVMHGGVNLIEAMKAKSDRLKRLKEEAAQNEVRQQELQEELERKKVERIDLEENYKSKKEEAQLKTKKIKKLWSVYQETKQEVEDIQSEFQSEREEYLYTIRELQRELKLKQKIIDGFIPGQMSKLIEHCASYDDGLSEWKIAGEEHAGNNVNHDMDDDSDSGMSGDYDDDYYQDENIDNFQNGNVVYFDYEVYNQM